MKFAICINSKGYDDLEAWKIYRLLPDNAADEVDCVRVIDESGEDYLYPASRFLMVNFSEDVQEKLLDSLEATS